ncbi:hypothetical protein, partial [Limosilactobacillus fermentum]|uniref:hypothetical protein n=1 Tax=Limosilactobacillus fermentum TaxID=1613 RepID=UPI001C9E293D
FAIAFDGSANQPPQQAVGEHVIRLTFINTVTSWEKARFSLSFFDGTKIPPPLKFASPQIW